MSNKTQRFIVEIVSSEEIREDGEINYMAQMIANAIVNGDREFGIQSNYNTNTEIVYVKGWYSDKQIIEHVN